MTDVTDRNVAVNGIQLRVATWGDPSRASRAVMLVHGLTANSRSWFELGPVLATRGRFVFAPDLRGRGRSAKPAHGYGLAFHADDLLKLGDAFDLPRFDLVGHSLGARIGLYLSAVHPARLRRLVLVDAGGTLPADAYEAIAPALARLGERFPSLDAYLATMRATTRLPWEPFGERYYRYDADIHPDGSVTSSVPEAAITEETLASYFTRTEALPAHVKAPTLIVRATVGLLGDGRGQILPRAEADRLLAEIADSRLVEIPETDHYTVVLADQFAREVIAFLDEQ